jgi:enoyl-CoA hydratase/carnithine racemase
VGYLDAERKGRVLVVRISNPPRHLMTGEMVEELGVLVATVEDDESIGAVVLTGTAEDTFIAHYDVEEILAGVEGAGPSLGARTSGGALRTVGAVSRVPGGRAVVGRTPLRVLNALKGIHDLFLRMNRSDTVFIAAINGTTMGGGCELCLACDLRLMADGPYRIGLPEITLGFIPGAGGTTRLTRSLGPAKALQLMLEAEVLDPPAAARTGLIHRVIPKERLLPEAIRAAEIAASRAPAAVKALKQAVYDGGAMDLEAALHLERTQFLASGSQEVSKQILRDFIEEQGRLAPDKTPWSDPDAFARWRERPAP